MVKVNRKLEYALMALKLLSERQNQNDLVSAKVVSETCHIPFDVTARVLQVMAQNSVLNVEHGAQGGYRISKDLGSVTLHQLMSMIQGSTDIAKCLGSGEEACEIEGHCNISAPIRQLNQKLNNFYQNLSVSEVLGL